MKSAWSVLLPLLALAACGTDAPPPQTYCPNVAVLEQARTLALYQPGHADIGGQLTTGTITGVKGSCNLLPEKHLLDVRFQAGFTATNGPANNGAPVTLPFFVSISQGDTIVSKTAYRITLNFNGNSSIANAISPPVKIELANVPQSGDIDILVGFQLN